MSRVLIITKDFALKQHMNFLLKHNGFSTQIANSSVAAWHLMAEIHFDIIMVDYRLKTESGLAFYKSIRLFGSKTPLLMIGEGKFDEFMLKDVSPENYDFILKPFKFAELKSKINGLLPQHVNTEDYVRFGAFKVDVKKQMIVVKDQFIKLGRIEMKILLLLAKKAGQVVHVNKIADVIEKEGQYFNMTTAYYIKKLTSKIQHLSEEAFEIIVVNNEGFKLEYKV